MLFVIMFILVWLPITIFYPTKVIGKKNFVKKQGAVVVCNHLSNLDPILLNIKLVKKIRFLGKAELFKSKFGSWFYRGLGAIPVNRGTADINAIKQGLKVLKDNKPLGIFPEGTRNKGEDETKMGEIHEGAIMFASRAGVPIIPIIIYKRPKFLRRNVIAVGTPFMVSGENPNKLTAEETQRAVEEMKTKMNELRETLDTKYNKKNKKQKTIAPLN